MSKCKSILEHAMVNAAKEIGDIVPAISRHFFSLHPEAQAYFTQHAPRNRIRLQSEMIDNCLYVIEQILEDSRDLKYTIELSINHHETSLCISRSIYIDLIRSTIFILSQNLDNFSYFEKYKWESVSEELDLIASSSI